MTMHGSKLFAFAVALLAFAGPPLPAATTVPGPLLARTGADSVQGVRDGDLIGFKG